MVQLLNLAADIDMSGTKRGGARPGAGRPSTFTKEIAKEICHRLCEGEPLRQICRDDHMPPWRTVHDWRHTNPDFEKEYQLARDLGMDAIAEDLLSISDTPTIGITKTYKGGELAEAKEEDMLGHRKLQIETRLKLLAKWNPKKYGESLTHRGDANAPLPLILNGSDVDG